MNDVSLRELQHRFLDHVLHGDGDMTALVYANYGPAAATRIAIYWNAYRLRLLEALRTDYPALHTLAGDALFERLGHDYIDACPPTHFSIRYFGKDLAAYIRRNKGYREISILAEMAQLEWMLTLSFDAPDSDPLGVETLAARPHESWPGMRLRFHDSLQRYDFEWNAPELWCAIEQHLKPETPVAYDQPRPWMIWRHDLQNYMRPLGTHEALALDSLRKGSDFAAMCGNLCEHIVSDEVGLAAAGFLKSWIREGLISEIL